MPTDLALLGAFLIGCFVYLAGYLQGKSHGCERAWNEMGRLGGLHHPSEDPPNKDSLS